MLTALKGSQFYFQLKALYMCMYKIVKQFLYKHLVLDVNKVRSERKKRKLKKEVKIQIKKEYRCKHLSMNL